MNILITGVSKGLGLRTAKYVLEMGWTVYGICRSETNELVNLKSEYKDTFQVLFCDLSEVKDIRKSIFKEWIGNETVINGLVNNAAIAYDDIITNLNEEPLENMFRLNVFIPMLLTKYTIRQMLLHNNNGCLLHISSISAHTGYKGLSMYASTKGALEAFSKNISREWGAQGIRSNCIVAGFMETNMSSNLTDDQKFRIYQRTSLKKGVDIDSVAETIVFLLSDKSKSITGQNIFIDNGTI